MTRFRDLSIGDTFDFINDAAPHLNSYFHRCVKKSARIYKNADDENISPVMHVGTINVEVFHVRKQQEWEETRFTLEQRVKMEDRY